MSSAAKSRRSPQSHIGEEEEGSSSSNAGGWISISGGGCDIEDDAMRLSNRLRTHHRLLRKLVILVEGFWVKLQNKSSTSGRK